MKWHKHVFWMTWPWNALVSQTSYLLCMLSKAGALNSHDRVRVRSASSVMLRSPPVQSQAMRSFAYVERWSLV